MAIKATIFNSPDKCMTGVELRRLRNAAGLSKKELADKMTAWSWYRLKVRRFENMADFGLNPVEMQALLDALGATSL